LVLVYEVLWCLTFIDEIAEALRSNAEFLQQLKDISATNTDESFKKTVDGLIWKLIQGICDEYHKITFR